MKNSFHYSWNAKTQPVYYEPIKQHSLWKWNINKIHLNENPRKNTNIFISNATPTPAAAAANAIFFQKFINRYIYSTIYPVSKALVELFSHRKKVELHIEIMHLIRWRKKKLKIKIRMRINTRVFLFEFRICIGKVFIFFTFSCSANIVCLWNAEESLFFLLKWQHWEMLFHF